MPTEKWRRPRKPHKLGILLAVFHFGAAIAYFYFRIKYTIKGAALEHPNYARYVLAVELLCAVSMVFYSFSLLCTTQTSKLEAKSQDPGARFPKYKLHILVATYKEDFNETVRETMDKARGINRMGVDKFTVYLCDDQPPPRPDSRPSDDKTNYERKVAYCNEHGDVVHLSRPASEMARDASKTLYVSTRNGKSCNVNHALDRIYENQGERLTEDDIIVILDCDQRLQSDFLEWTLHLFAAHEDIAMVITPQRFHNVKPRADVLNHINSDYWDLLLPGQDGLGFISCPGTNFLVRGSALLYTREMRGRPEWVPTFTVTEDFALGMDMKAAGFEALYVNRQLCIGEAPNRVTDSFIQRRRWAMGHFQIMLSLKTPFLKRGLSIWMRLLYGSSVYTYLTSILATFTLTAIPLINIWLGWFPLTITTEFVISFIVYFLATILLKYGPTFGNKDLTVQAVWFASCANSLFCMSYLYAALAALPYKVHFQVTPKGQGREKCWSRVKSSLETVFSALWLNCFFFAFSIISLFAAAVKMRQSNPNSNQQAAASPFQTPVVLCMAWVAYNTMPHLLLIIWSVLHTPAYATAEQRCDEHKQIEEEAARRRRRQPARERDPEAVPGRAEAQRAASARVAAKTAARIHMDRVAEKLLEAACFAVQLTSGIILVGIFVFTFTVAFMDQGMQTWCGLFPFYFTDTIGINRFHWTHHPNCSRVEPFVRG